MRSLHVFVKYDGSLDEMTSRVTDALGRPPDTKDQNTRTWIDASQSYTLAPNPVESEEWIDFGRYEYFVILCAAGEDEPAAREAFRRLTKLDLPIMLVDELADILEQYEPA